MTTHQKQIKALFDKSRKMMKTYLREEAPIKVIDIYQNDPNVPWRTYSGFGYGPEWEWKGGYVELVVECSIKKDITISSICEYEKPHMYVRITLSDDTPVLYHCFKCNESGIINKEWLDYFGLDIKIPKQTYRKKLDIAEVCEMDHDALTKFKEELLNTGLFKRTPSDPNQYRCKTCPFCGDGFWYDNRLKKGRHKPYFRFWRDGDSPELVYFD